MLSYFLVFMSSMLAYYTTVFIADHSAAPAVWHVDTLEFGILALMLFLFVAEHNAVLWDCRDPRVIHGSCGVTTPLSSGVRRRVNHYSFAQFFAKCGPDPAATYLAY